MGWIDRVFRRNAATPSGEVKREPAAPVAITAASDDSGVMTFTNKAITFTGD